MQSSLDPSSGRRSRRMRLGVPVAIVIIGAALAFYSWRQRAVEADAIEVAVRDLLAEPAGPEVVPGLDAVLGPGRDAVAGGALCAVDVRFGDVPEIGNGDATHHVLVDVGGQPWLGLRFLMKDDTPGIIGYWHPEGSAAREAIVAPSGADGS